MGVRTAAVWQAVFLPFGVMLALMGVGLAVPGYDSVAQHLSELGLLGGWPARMEQVAGIVSGGSILVFSLALLADGRRFACTALTSVLFGLSMVGNGVFPMGSPLHGLYGIGFFVVLVPLFFLLELGPVASARIRWASRLAALLTLTYLWSMLAGLDPLRFHGLTRAWRSSRCLAGTRWRRWSGCARRRDEPAHPAAATTVAGLSASAGCVRSRTGARLSR